MPRGSTAGIQQFLRAQGIEWGDSASHDYHFWFDGDTLFTDAQFVFGGLSPWVDATRYGADASGSADSAGAIQSALNAAAGTGTNGTMSTVFLPPGTYTIKTPLYVPNKVVLRGATAYGSIIKAHASFPVSTPLVSLGRLTDTGVYNCRIEDLIIDCSSVVGSVGLYSNQLNEQSGGKRVSVINYMAKGFQIVTDPAIVGGYNWLFEDIGAGCAATSTGSFGFHMSALTAGFGYGKITRLSVVPFGPGQIGTTGLYVGGAGEMGAWLEDIHVEDHVNGVHFDTNAIGFGLGLTAGGASFTTNAVLLDAVRQVELMAVRGTNVTNLIVDNKNSVTIAPFWYGLYTNHDTTLGALHLAATFSKIVPGATSLSIRDNADATTNVLISNAGLMTLKSLLVTLTATLSGGLQLPAGTTGTPPLNIPQGAAPTSPTNGDIWTTSSGLFVRINGATIGPLS